MTYKLAQLNAYDVASLKDVKIPNVQKTEVDGKILDLMEAYTAVKALSDDFKKDNANAEKIDTMLWQVLESVDFFKKSDIAKATIATMPKAVETTPSVPTTEKSQKEILEAKIKTFERVLKFAKGDEKDALEKKIKTFQRVLKFAK